MIIIGIILLLVLMMVYPDILYLIILLVIAAMIFTVCIHIIETILGYSVIELLPVWMLLN